MCKLSLQLLLHINSKFAGLNGYTTAAVVGSTSRGEAAETSSQNKQRDMGSAGLLVQEILYATSGCLHNIARHPHNVYILYNIELKVKIRRAAADLLTPRGTPHNTPGAANSTSIPIGPSSQTALATGVRRAATDPEPHENQPGGLKGDHVRDMAHVNIPNIDLTTAQQDVSYKNWL